MPLSLSLSSPVILSRTFDSELVRSIMVDPELFSRISEDGISADSWNPPMDGSAVYLALIQDDIPAGLWIVHAENSTTLKVHLAMLKKYRHKRHDAMALFYQWFLEECPNKYFKLIAEIPEIYPEVRAHAKKYGFVDEGINRASVRKRGEIVNQWRLGITRSEIMQMMRS